MGHQRAIEQLFIDALVLNSLSLSLSLPPPSLSFSFSTLERNYVCVVYLNTLDFQYSRIYFLGVFSIATKALIKMKIKVTLSGAVLEFYNHNNQQVLYNTGSPTGISSATHTPKWKTQNFK